MLLAMIKSWADQQPAVRAVLRQEYYFRARSLRAGLSLTLSSTVAARGQLPSGRMFGHLTRLLCKVAAA
jgi:hypothetical protein